MKKKLVGILSHLNFNEPSIRLRLKLPLEILSRNQHEIEVVPIILNSERTFNYLKSNNQVGKVFSFLLDFFSFFILILRYRKKMDFVFVKNYAISVGGDAIEALVLRLLAPKKILYDIDDGTYINSTRPQNKFFANFRLPDQKVAFWARKADKILSCNRILKKDLIDLFGVDDKKFVSYVTSPMRNQYFVSPEEIEPNKPLDKLIVVWIGSHHTSYNLELFRDSFEYLARVYPTMEFHIVGSSCGLSWFEKIPQIKVIQWSPDSEKKALRQAHFGLNPLFASDFEIRKCAFKVIQYFRAGVIPIVSDVGINKDLVDKFGGLAVKDFSKHSVLKDFIEGVYPESFYSASRCIFNKTAHFSMESLVEILSKEIINAEPDSLSYLSDVN